MENYSLINLPKDDPYKFSDFRCLSPYSTTTGKPYFPFENVCPCDPKHNNPTGRGYTLCPYGVQMDHSRILHDSNISIPLKKFVKSNTGTYDEKTGYADIPNGSMFPGKQYVPPQIYPRQLTRIGEVWRSAW